MTDCEHCSETFEDDAAYLRHLDDEHPEEMGRIERRRLEELGGSGGGAPTALVVGALAVGALILAIVLYTLTTGGSGGDSELGELGPAPNPPGHDLGPPSNDEVYHPYRYQGVHNHGNITMVIGDEDIDFRNREFQHPQEIRDFHFEGGQSYWHAHARGVTLEYALEATAFGVTNSSLAYDGVVYREGSNDTVPEGWEVVTDVEIRYRVNGEPVDPETYVLQDGDSVVVQVELPQETDGEDASNSTNESAANSTGTVLVE